MPEILLINLVGTDRPGLTNALTTSLAAHRVEIYDIGQAVIHDHLSLGMLVGLPEGPQSYEALKDLLYTAHGLNLSIRFTPISPEEYEVWVGQQAQERTIVTMLGRTISASNLSALTGVLIEQGLNIEKISRLSRRLSLKLTEEEQRSCIEFSVLGRPKDRQQMRQDFMSIAQDGDVDVAVQSDDMYRRHRRLFVFDMDSTLIQCEVIDELARLHGVYDQVSAITEAAMRGELDFKASFTQRVGLLKGLEMEKVIAFADRLPLTEGAERLVDTLNKLGFKTAICSGGFTIFGERLKEILGIDFVFANELDHEDGRLTGKVKGEIVDAQRKAALMRLLAADMNISLQQVVAVGDGANDLPMIGQAGLGIAFRAKPVVRANAKQALSVLGLDGMLYLIGVRDREILSPES
jgi:phosphoserine phosphatase